MFVIVQDKYIICSLVLMHTSSCWHALISLFDEDSAPANWADVISFVIFTTLFLLCQLVFALIVKSRVSLDIY